jgi:NTE family protein
MMVGICISGGGAKIGFAIGVLETMESKGINPEIAYGISSGSLCTAALCYGSVDFLKSKFLEIQKKEEVLKPQLLKVLMTQITGMGKADGIYSMKRMRKKLNQLPADEPLKNGVVGYVDLKSGEIKYVSSSDVGKEDFLNAVQASCSIPLVMQTLRIGEEVRVDGGVRDMLPLKQLIDDPIKVDEIHVVSLNPLTPGSKDIGKKIVPVALRTVDLILNEVLQSDIKIAKIYNMILEQGMDKLIPGKRLIKLYEYVPTKHICDSIDFRKENIQKGIDHGIEIANKVLKNYPSQ